MGTKKSAWAHLTTAPPGHISHVELGEVKELGTERCCTMVCSISNSDCCGGAGY